MTPRGRAGRARLWLAGPLWTALSFGSVAFPLPYAAAAPPASAAAASPVVTATTEATLSLSTVTPAVARAGQDVRLTVSVGNSGDQELAGASVVVLLDGRRIRERADVVAWAEAEGTTSRAHLLAEAQVPILPGGGTASVTLTVPAAQIASGRSYAVLPLALALRGGDRQIAQLHTFLPWQRVKEYRPLTVAFVAPLTLDPDPALFGPVTEVTVAAWRRAVGPDSRLQRIVDATADLPVTWAADPAIFGTDDPATESVGGGTGGGAPAETPPATETAPTATTAATPAPTTPSTEPTTAPIPEPTTEPTSQDETPDEQLAELIAGLSGRISAASPGQTVWRLPFSDPDLLAVRTTAPATPLLPELVARKTDLAAWVGTEVTGGVFGWPATGPLTRAREQWLRQVFAGDALTSVLTWVSQLPAPSGYTGEAARRSAGGLPLLAADDELSRQFAAASGGEGATVAAQRFLADSMALLDERAGTPRTVLVTAPRTYAPDPQAVRSLFGAIASTPWLTVVDTGEIIRDAATAEPENVPGDPGPTTVTPTAVAPSPLTTDRVRDIPRTISRVEGVAQILPTAVEFQQGWTQAQEQLLSTRWRGGPAAWETVDRATEAAVATVSQGVRVEPRTINFFADEGVIQLTVLNTLDTEVHDVILRLAVPGAQANRLRIAGQPEPLRIAANSRTTVRQQVTATASGRVTIIATLRSPNGTVLGSPTEVRVRVQPTATWVFWVLGIITGTIMVLGLVRGLRGGRRRAGPPPALAEPAEPVQSVQSSESGTVVP